MTMKTNKTDESKNETVNKQNELRASYKMRKAIERVEKKSGGMDKHFFVERDECNRVGRGFYDGCILSDRLLQRSIIVNHEGEIFY